MRTLYALWLDSCYLLGRAIGAALAEVEAGIRDRQHETTP